MNPNNNQQAKQSLDDSLKKQDEQELLFPVREIFCKLISNGQYFNIPEYQRGYKWNASNVKTLLDDLLKFEQSEKSRDAFYCLQNITLVPINSNGELSYYNVVDGQQRLTTLYIILSYLVHCGNNDNKTSFEFSPNCIRYSVREETEKKLKEEIATGKIWQTEISAEIFEKTEYKDYWYILDVARGVKDWFDTNSIHIDTILERLKLIVNVMTDGDEESIFAGLNSGKVDLDGSDLMRAELITRAAREKYGEISPTKVREFRILIGLELDEIGHWWSDKDRQTFFQQMLPKIETDEFKIKKDNYGINTLYQLYFLVTKKEDDVLDFRFFEHGIDTNKLEEDDHWELYETLMQMHKTLKEWYERPEIYHWLGYLFFNFKKEVNFSAIWNEWKEIEKHGTDRQSFIDGIKKRICELFDFEHTDILAAITDLNHDWYIDNQFDKLQVLIELLWIEKNGYKHHLSVDYLCSHEEDREHIRSCSPNPSEGDKVVDKNEWIKFVEKTYDNREDIDIKSELMALLDTFGEKLTDANIISINEIMTNFHQNSFGNLVLLNKHVNRSYRNALYQEKVNRIIDEYMKIDYYIRPYTLNVFLRKINDESDKEWRWTKNNIKEKAEEAADLLNTLVKNLK